MPQLFLLIGNVILNFEKHIHILICIYFLVVKFYHSMCSTHCVSHSKYLTKTEWTAVCKKVNKWKCGFVFLTSIDTIDYNYAEHYCHSMPFRRFSLIIYYWILFSVYEIRRQTRGMKNCITAAIPPRAILVATTFFFDKINNNETFSALLCCYSNVFSREFRLNRA